MRSPALRYARRVTPELHFDGTSNSSVTFGAIHNAAAKMWLSFWFKPTNLYDSSSGSLAFLWGKRLDDDNKAECYINGGGNGQITFRMKVGGGAFDFSINSIETSWRDNLYHHIIFSISSAEGVRMVIDGGAARTNADTTALPNGGSIVVGNRNVDNGGSFDGEIRDVAIGTDDLSSVEERGLLKGIIPADATEFYRLNEGYGTTAIDLGTGGNDGTIDSANRWETGLRQYVKYS